MTWTISKRTEPQSEKKNELVHLPIRSIVTRSHNSSARLSLPRSTICFQSATCQFEAEFTSLLGTSIHLTNTWDSFNRRPSRDNPVHSSSLHHASGAQVASVRVCPCPLLLMESNWTAMMMRFFLSPLLRPAPSPRIRIASIYVLCWLTVIIAPGHSGLGSCCWGGCNLEANTVLITFFERPPFRYIAFFCWALVSLVFPIPLLGFITWPQSPKHTLSLTILWLPLGRDSYQMKLRWLAAWSVDDEHGGIEGIQLHPWMMNIDLVKKGILSNSNLTCYCCIITRSYIFTSSEYPVNNEINSIKCWVLLLFAIICPEYCMFQQKDKVLVS